MGLFRKRSESYNERMLREAGLLDWQQQETKPIETPSLLRQLGVPDGASPSPREWDATTTVTASGLSGSRVEFTSLPGGDLLVDDDESGDLSPFADALERDVEPPYRALAVRQEGDLWAVAARRIETARFEFAGADSVELSRKDSWEELRADGDPSDATVPPQLRRLGERQGSDFFVKAERLDGDLWEVRVSAL